MRAPGAFALQPGFVASTEQVGDKIAVRPIANQRRPWFTAMDALIEAWSQPGEFGLAASHKTRLARASFMITPPFQPGSAS